MPVLAIAIAINLGLAALSLFVGVSQVSLSGLWAGQDDQWLVLIESRLPRMAALILAGATMAIAGVLTQTLIRNRFVEPSNTGMMEAAGLGLLLMMLLFPAAPIIAKMAVGTVFAMAGTAIFLAILRRVPMRDPMLVPLIGIMLSGIIFAGSSFVAYRFDMVQSLLAWTQGDLSGVMRGRYELLWLAAVGAGLAWFAADRFTVAGLGRDMASSLGLSHGRVVALGLAIVSLVTAIVVVSVGMIPFLGLIVPNIVSLALGDNMRRAIPWAAIGGAGLVLFCDILGRVIIMPYEVPVGTIMGVIGSAVFLWLIAGRRRAA
ncbi:ABC transporter permease [Paracoccus homiensis]|uniref:Iron complex transport system permease protein n=1 Tax=Paracoccus homiensis TaxID=364199 RepID=A0A1I0IRM4_9RHOB|nr:iron chelate uptake ABC transporter family permease subunit [Paracoccus homiensis]SET99846.1 iron complex transport system permease protein [Paracoccus homiensis]